MPAMLLAQDWRHARLADARRVPLRHHADARGALDLLDNARGELGFRIDRCFFLSEVPPDGARGGHANTATHEALIALGGALEVELDDGFARERMRLAPLREALLVPAGLWLRVSGFRAGAICAVLASGAHGENRRLPDRRAFAALKREAGP